MWSEKQKAIYLGFTSVDQMKQALGIEDEVTPIPQGEEHGSCPVDTRPKLSPWHSNLELSPFRVKVREGKEPIIKGSVWVTFDVIVGPYIDIKTPFWWHVIGPDQLTSSSGTAKSLEEAIAEVKDAAERLGWNVSGEW